MVQRLPDNHQVQSQQVPTNIIPQSQPLLQPKIAQSEHQQLPQYVSQPPQVQQPTQPQIEQSQPQQHQANYINVAPGQQIQQQQQPLQQTSNILTSLDLPAQYYSQMIVSQPLSSDRTNQQPTNLMVQSQQVNPNSAIPQQEMNQIPIEAPPIHQQINNFVGANLLPQAPAIYQNLQASQPPIIQQPSQGPAFAAPQPESAPVQPLNFLGEIPLAAKQPVVPQQTTTRIISVSSEKYIPDVPKGDNLTGNRKRIFDKAGSAIFDENLFEGLPNLDQIATLDAITKKPMIVETPEFLLGFSIGGASQQHSNQQTQYAAVQPLSQAYPPANHTASNQPQQQQLIQTQPVFIPSI
eukprot:TRINITY_DN4305_c0_g1_i4.p1 TRINITY_DN4305_c0_g1~~TRINITY_DN4305_c0_g1_i4.p1  ORF type:complete len:352 (-),score=57.71 TRINITY_DN4305_c0_g1_i4:147-1202(-)